MNSFDASSWRTSRTDWQSGSLSYATAELVNEFSTVDPLQVMEAVKAAIDEVPVRDGVAMLLPKAREILRARLLKTV